MSRIITLTTDWHNSDYYVATVKASILSKTPEVNIVDISHQIEQYSVKQAAFVLRSAYKLFPKGTVHIIGVDSEPGKDGNILIAKYEDQYFVCNNNGSTSLIFDSEPEIAVLAETGFAFNGASFTELNIFSEIACFICKDGDIRDLGTENADIFKFPELLPPLEANVLNGEVIYIDSYSNVITNITKEMFYKYVGDSKYEIFLNSNLYKSSRIHNGYKEVDKGELICIFNSLGLLEVAIREGKASQLLSLKRKSEIRVKFNL